MNTEKNTDPTKTAYQLWKSSLPKKMNLSKLWRVSRKQRLIYKPYLSEDVIGGGFELQSFVYLIAFIAVIVFWVSTALPMIGGLVGWFGPKKAAASSPALLRESDYKDDGAPFLVATPTMGPTEEPTPTSTMEPAQAPTPTMGPTQQPNEIKIGFAVLNPNRQYEIIDAQIRLSFYYPDYGGINCDQVNGVDECEFTAWGEDWHKYIGYGAACPKELKRGTIVEVGSYRFECMDRGNAIVKENGYYWLDILFPNMPFNRWGDVVQGRIYIPLEEK